ncbi:MAG: phosphoribosylaminoimidazolesuccinocarboxamide synthase [Proteobacteria bacterium]|nr:phosphoribosylaminoimidazolesuccinocarboxamide synthase [Pseudomonadota bacterium]
MTQRTLRRIPLYESEEKFIFEGPEPGTFIQHFKDEMTAVDRKGIIQGKGVLNNRISELLMTQLEELGISTHFVRCLNMREQVVKALDLIPLKIVVRNVSAGSFVKRFGLDEGIRLPRTIVEFYHKDENQDKVLVSEEHITAFGWATPSEIEEMMTIAYRVNDFLTGLFFGIGIRLVDFRLEFGRLYGEFGEDIRLVISDEITPDSCRLWDLNSNQPMDKDRFKLNLGNESAGYQEVARRLGVWGHDIEKNILLETPY